MPAPSKRTASPAPPVYCWKERFAAILGALLLGTSVYFHAAISWDYVDGPGVAGLLLLYALLTAAAMTRWSPYALFVAGLTVTTAGEKPTVSVGQLVAVEQLEAIPWATNGRNGVAFRAVSLKPLASPSAR